MLNSYRAALITGSSSGIGAAFARLLAPETDLVIAGRNQTRLMSLAAELARPGRRIEVVVADLATPQGRQAVIDRAEHSAIDLLISNAGSGIAGNFCSNPSVAEREAIALNIVAGVELLHALLPPMIARARQERRRCGAIIVSSMAAFAARAGLASYAASKAFQLRLTEALAEELQSEPIDILGLCPTITRTEFFARAGMPMPPQAMPPETVAHQAMAALGRHTVHLCATGARLNPWRSGLHRAFGAARSLLHAARRARKG